MHLWAFIINASSIYSIAIHVMIGRVGKGFGKNKFQQGTEPLHPSHTELCIECLGNIFRPILRNVHPTGQGDQMSL
jgi:hypothetical protein